MLGCSDPTHPVHCSPPAFMSVWFQRNFDIFFFKRDKREAAFIVICIRRNLSSPISFTKKRKLLKNTGDDIFINLKPLRDQNLKMNVEDFLDLEKVTGGNFC